MREAPERGRAVESELRFLAEAGQALSSSLEYEQTLRVVARLAVPAVADWSAVYVLEGEDIRTVEVAHVEPDKAELARDLERRYPRDPETSLVHRAVRTGEPVLVRDIPDAMITEAARDEEHRNALRRMGLRSALIVPMSARGRVLGAISFLSASRRYDESDVAFAAELAARAALAIDNARLYEQAERRAREEAALRRATGAVAESFTVERIIHQIAESALVATGATGSFVERVDLEAGEVEVVAVAGGGVPEVGVRVPYAGSSAEWVIEHGRPEAVADLAASGRTMPKALPEACPGCPGVVVPLLDAGAAIGALFLLRAARGRHFDADEVERAFTFGKLAALAFRKVHLLEQSERRREELEQVMESRSRLMRGFSHDVKNPLGAADGFAQLLEDGVLGELEPRQREGVRRLRRSIRSALALIDDLLELARAEVGQLDIVLQPVDARDAVREIGGEYRAQAEAKGLGLETRIPQKFPTTRSDASRVRQVLGNLLSNAVKYTHEGGIVLGLELRAGGGAPGPGLWIAIDVSDTGPGIPAEQQPRLFQEFTRLDAAAAGGAGIGLAISQRIAHALGGVITYEGGPGRGSTFTFWLPADDSGPVTPGTPPAPPSAP